MSFPIRPEFTKIIGQDRAKQMLSMAASAGDNERDMLSVLFQGKRGLGKTKVMYAYGDALCNSKKKKRKLLRIQPRDIRLINDTWNDLVETIVSGVSYVLEIDEAHELVTDGTKQHNTLFNFIRRALDGNNKGRTIPFDASKDQFAVFDRSQHVINCGTNYSYLLDDSNALQSRFTELTLDLYTESQLKQIALVMAEALDLEFKVTREDDPVALMARCGRGTARFLERIFEQLCLFDKAKITQNHVFMALKNLKMYPRGLDDKEIMLLVSGEKHEITRTQFLATSGMESADLKDAIAYLTHPEVAFVELSGSGKMSTTKRGNAYLKKIVELGFTI